MVKCPKHQDLNVLWGDAMENTSVRVHRRARWKLEQLPEPVRRQVLAAAEQLQGVNPEQWPGDKVVRVNGPKPFFRLDAAPDLYAFIRHAGANEIEIDDVMPKD